MLSIRVQETFPHCRQYPLHLIAYNAHNSLRMDVYERRERYCIVMLIVILLLRILALLMMCGEVTLIYVSERCDKEIDNVYNF